MQHIENYKLTGAVTVGELQFWMEDKSDESKIQIVNLIEHRFSNRYLKHIEPLAVDSGFLIMAVCCFVIETLQSFREGEEDTRKIGKRMFKNYFTNEVDHFPGFLDISDEFYKHIRCGILHQSETTGAWRILRSGKIVEIADYSINARLFLKAVKKTVDKYVKELNETDFDSMLWKNAFIKLKDICKNCERD